MKNGDGTLRDLPAGEDSPRVSAELLALEQLPESRSADAARIADIRSTALHRVKATLQVCVGKAVMTVGELLTAREGQLITLDRKIDQSVDIVVEGQVIARGQLVAVDDVFGVQVTELPIPFST